MSEAKISINPKGVMCLAVIIALAFVCVHIFTDDKIDTISVEYTQNAKATAQSQNLDDYYFIRLSELLSEHSKNLTELQAVTADNIAKSGIFKLDSMQKTGRKSVKITISARQGLIAVSSGGKYYSVDEEFYITEVKNDYESSLGIPVYGITLTRPTKGSVISDSGSSEKLTAAVQIASLISDNGYSDKFTDITLLENQWVLLGTKQNVPVKFNRRFDILTSLDVASAMLNDNLTDGYILVSGDNEVGSPQGFYCPDASDLTTSKGM